MLEEFFLKPIIFVVPVIWFLSRDHKVTPSLLGFRTENKKKMLLWGGGFGSFLVLEGIITWVFIKDHQFILPSFLYGWFFALSIPFATAISEEMFYRGFLMEQLWQKFENAWFANITSTTLFVVGHIAQGVFIFHYRGSELFLYFFLMAILGYANGVIYRQTRSIYATIFFHALWNMSNVFIT